ncbi:myosin light chain kinase 3 isoform X1 [Esox lucius]|uniref:myosin light chain kinase 3 isoform X1 n=1 Tax=Esox lucius TaxID=8010 RepID=UPI001476A325|nr:myosin light chain kinase 3 isoform X1 [Esox lucius]
MSSSLVNSLAKVYDPNPLHGQKPVVKRLTTGPYQPHTSSSPDTVKARCTDTESRMDSLSSQMEHLLQLQETVLTRLDGLSRDLGGVGREVASLRAGGWGSGGTVVGQSRDETQLKVDNQVQEVVEACRELQGVVQEASRRVEQQGRRLEGIERLVEGMHQVINFIGEMVKGSRLAELLFNKTGGFKARKLKDNGIRDVKDKAKFSIKGLKSHKKKKPPDASDSVELLLQDQVEKLNRQNAECSFGKVVQDTPHTLAVQSEDLEDAEGWKDKTGTIDCEEEPRPTEEEEGNIFGDSEAEEEEGREKGAFKVEQVVEEEVLDRRQVEEVSSLSSRSEELAEVAACSKRCVTEEDLVKDDLKKSRVEERNEEGGAEEIAEAQAAWPGGEKTGGEKTGGEEVDGGRSNEYIIDSSPPPAAPFNHRIVTPKPHQIATFYAINKDEVLGGGRFGQVHKCVENSSGLMLAAKIIKARSQKEKEVVKNEIQVMNQLNHANLIQLYAAFESRTDIILIMEYVDGGELFDRIIDENHNLTELDTVLFIRQICEGLQYMHKMYILHLDLKPENILCVSRATNKIKIIDFGLARRYKPREKLRVNFGTPEFLAPEVINYEFVSFPTDMWSLGVITYMLLTGLSPFLGDDDNETLNNILACQWNFEVDEFTEISEEAKDFITCLLIKSKSWRMSASQSLKHSWLSDRNLHYRLHQKKNKCHSTHSPPPRRAGQDPKDSVDAL